MTVTLTREQEELVQGKLQSGSYDSPNDVIGESLRLLAEREERQPELLAELRREIKMGLDQLDRGEGIPGDQAYAILLRKRQEFLTRPNAV